MSVKIQPVQSAEKTRVIKKLYCPDHGLKFKYKCEHRDCPTPFICPKDECLQSHLHENGIITMSKFNCEQFQQKLEKMQTMVFNSEKIFNAAKQVKFVVDGLKSSLVTIFNDLKTFNQNCDSLKEHLDSCLTTDYLNRLDNVYALEGRLSTGIQSLRAKLAPAKDQDNQQQTNHQQPESQPNKLALFLEENISNFKWESAHQIYSLSTPLTTCEKFHDRLAGKKNLIFIFSTDSVVVGSYFSVSYPSISEKNKKDLESFIFLSDEGEFVKFVANPECQSHITVSEKILVCQGNTPSYGDGIRTFQKNFDTLDFCLPSKCYKAAVAGSEKEYNGTLKIKSMQILQFD